MDAEEHRKGFLDFVAFESATGGPSPNLKLIGKAAAELPSDRTSQAWLAATYAAIYNTPGALVLWHEVKPEYVIEDLDTVTAFLEERKAGLPVHSNRLRTHGSMKKLALGLKALAEFVLEDGFEKADDYDKLWDQVTSVDAVGRYFGIKFAGALHQLGLTEARQYDIRAKGAKNGRKTLALIYPEFAEELELKTGGNSFETVAFVEEQAEDLRISTHSYGLNASWFQFEALLCEYNQMVKGDRYAGKTSDSDLEALVKVEEYWGVKHPAVGQTWAARAEALPPFAYDLRKRKDLLDVYEKHGYLWSDALYEYETTENFAHPSLLHEPLTDWQPLLDPR